MQMRRDHSAYQAFHYCLNSTFENKNQQLYKTISRVACVVSISLESSATDNLEGSLKWTSFPSPVFPVGHLVPIHPLPLSISPDPPCFTLLPRGIMNRDFRWDRGGWVRSYMTLRVMRTQCIMVLFFLTSIQKFLLVCRWLGEMTS